MSFTRREFLKACVGGTALAVTAFYLRRYLRRRWLEQTFIAKVTSYQADLAGVMVAGLRELGIRPEEIKGKRVLLKPNLVESKSKNFHINTHPLVVRGAAEAFLKLGASRVLVAEGPGHCQDTLRVFEESGLFEVLREDQIPFIDLNYQDGYVLPNAGKYSRLTSLTFPSTLKQVDLIVSVAKLKTHHLAGVTLSLKNMFGVMPGIYYGWPKNLLHYAGIEPVILDINATLRPHLAIVDGIVGMEGDGPIMGDPKAAGVLVMGRNLAAVDSTCARIMKIDPYRVNYLNQAQDTLGPVKESSIIQVGEPIGSVATEFKLLDYIPAQKGLRG
ncbi:MAG: DUF362 domain-containing protein [Deltaproteobacteria bacterium]|nr:DUF362 domain-containing protein [Deltaproteobacteria bacterium]